MWLNGTTKTLKSSLKLLNSIQNDMSEILIHTLIAIMNLNGQTIWPPGVWPISLMKPMVRVENNLADSV